MARRRKANPSEAAKRKHITVLPLHELHACGIKKFCAAHDISIDTYYRMARAGLGPAIMKVGHRTLISAEAAAAWRRAREQGAA